MACIEVHIKRVSSEIVPSCKQSGSIYAKASLFHDEVAVSFGRADTCLSAISGIVQWESDVKFLKVGSISAWSSVVCSPNIGPEPVIPEEKYLEIEPEVLWVFSGIEAFNDVFSNVTWRVL